MDFRLEKRSVPDQWIRIRIRNLFVRIRILSSTGKKMKENLDFCCFVTIYDFLSLKNDVNVPYKSN
jgi:hypothetical protein